MVWQRAGTVSVQNGSTTVTGSGVDFAASSRVGDSFVGPDGATYEVGNVASATVISILPTYKGATVSGATYAIMPVQGYDKMLSDAFNSLVNQFGVKLAALGTTGNYDILPAAKGGTGNNTGTAAKLAAAAVVGTVSQSGGAPTGALFESGINANGAYVKFADGTMICRRTLGVFSIGPNATLNDGARSFAANFGSTPSLSFAWNCDYPYDISIGAEGGINSSSFRVSMKNRNSSVTVSNIYVDVTAMGRWY